MTTRRIATFVTFLLLYCCSPRAQTTEDRTSVDGILTAHGLPKLPPAALNLSAVSTSHQHYNEHKIHFVCTPIECAQFISKIAGAPAHDSESSVAEVTRHLETGPPGQVLRDRDITEEPKHTYIMSERRPDGTLRITIELENIH